MRLRRLGMKTPLPAGLLSNACSLNTKIDELSGLLGSIHLKNTAVLVITETWLKPGTSDVQVAVTGFTIHRADRTTQSGKARLGGIAFYINDRQSSNNVPTTIPHRYNIWVHSITIQNWSKTKPLGSCHVSTCKRPHVLPLSIHVNLSD